MQGIGNAHIMAVPTFDAMGHRHIGVIIDSPKLVEFGYIYILHEEAITEA